MKFFFIRATMVKGMKEARKRSAQARLTKYLLFVNRIGPREPNITRRAAKLPNTARRKITNEKPMINHSLSVIFHDDEDDRFSERETVDERFRTGEIRQDVMEIIDVFSKNDEEEVSNPYREREREEKKALVCR